MKGVDHVSQSLWQR